MMHILPSVPTSFRAKIIFLICTVFMTVDLSVELEAEEKNAPSIADIMTESAVRHVPKYTIQECSRRVHIPANMDEKEIDQEGAFFEWFMVRWPQFAWSAVTFDIYSDPESDKKFRTIILADGCDSIDTYLSEYKSHINDLGSRELWMTIEPLGEVSVELAPHWLRTPENNLWTNEPLTPTE